MVAEVNDPHALSDGHAVSSAKSVLAALDDSDLSGFHLKAMITSGMGFFTDAYDLFIIGVVLAILTPIWHLSALEISLLGSTSLIAAALGAVIFGRLADHIGRHAIYGYTLIVLAIGALASAFAPGVIWLIVFRFILGLGIGGDYPLSATLMSEYANRRDRGKLVTMVFSMQGLGLVLGPLVAIVLLLVGMQHDLTWRIMLALGAVPALGTFYLRRQIAETPRYALTMQGDVAAAARTVNVVTKKQHGDVASIGGSASADSSTPGNAPIQGMRRPKRSWLYLLVTPPYLRWLIGAAGAWFLLDVAYYGTTISSPLVLKSLNPHSELVTNMLYTLLIFVVAGLLAVAPALTTITLSFLLVYGVSYFFTEFGPNVTTFVYPAEIFPVMVRTTGHGIAAAVGKVGAFIGAFIFPFLLHSFSLPVAMGFAGIISLAGLALTVFTLPEPNQRSLEDISDEHAVKAAHEERERELVLQ